MPAVRIRTHAETAASPATSRNVSGYSRGWVGTQVLAQAHLVRLGIKPGIILTVQVEHPKWGWAAGSYPPGPPRALRAARALEPHPSLPANNILISGVSLGVSEAPCPHLAPPFLAYSQAGAATGRAQEGHCQPQKEPCDLGDQPALSRLTITTEFSHFWNLPLPGRPPLSLT